MAEQFKNPQELANAMQPTEQKAVPGPIYNPEDWKEREKTGKRFISQITPGTGYVNAGKYTIDENVGGKQYYRTWDKYEDALNYLNEQERLEGERRAKLAANYQNPDYPLDQFEQELMREFLGNKHKAFKWLLENGRIKK